MRYVKLLILGICAVGWIRGSDGNDSSDEVIEVMLEKESDSQNSGFITKFPKGRFAEKSWSNNPSTWLGWATSFWHNFNIKATYHTQSYIQIEFFNKKNPAPYNRYKVLKLTCNENDLVDFTNAIMQFCADVGIKGKDLYECVLSGINSKITDDNTYNKYSRIIKIIFYKYTSPTFEMKFGGESQKQDIDEQITKYIRNRENNELKGQIINDLDQKYRVYKGQYKPQTQDSESEIEESNT